MFGLTPFNDSVVRKNRKEQSLSDFVDDFFGDDFFPMRNLRHDTFKVDVRDDEDKFIIEADMPGVKKEEIQIDYHEGLMSISINHEETKEEKEKSYVHRERRRCSMSRNLNLGDLDFEKIEASLKDGILKIIAPKAKVVENKKRIQIK
jgi:HSP20 family protein